MKTTLMFLVLVLAPVAVQAEGVTVSGKLGFMGEWEVKANAREQASAAREFSGPLTLTHVGLCTVNGPVEKLGGIRFRRTGLVGSGIEATLTFDGKQCTFAARGAKTYEGTLECSGGGIPLRLQIEFTPAARSG
ncbi:MAG: hypothetical protein R3D62_21280 [Xanthobacteraceae bacterium]